MTNTNGNCSTARGRLACLSCVIAIIVLVTAALGWGNSVQDTRIARAEASVRQVELEQASMHERLRGIEERLARIENKVDKLLER